ncbi:hypothetical protein PAHAL_5G285300 [Panicum hallii]|uniref:Uncharacterized protein n=1 Tax=Panicum hallii TaxID=206008 RepID=A0A2S3HV38_9POAL|nr:hypothetical protein PAHAL_5G285300 [Panicum hallii]
MGLEGVEHGGGWRANEQVQAPARSPLSCRRAPSIRRRPPSIDPPPASIEPPAAPPLLFLAPAIGRAPPAGRRPRSYCDACHHPRLLATPATAPIPGQPLSGRCVDLRVGSLPSCPSSPARSAGGWAPPNHAHPTSVISTKPPPPLSMRERRKTIACEEMMCVATDNGNNGNLI